MGEPRYPLMAGRAILVAAVSLLLLLGAPTRASEPNNVKGDEGLSFPPDTILVEILDLPEGGEAREEALEHLEAMGPEVVPAILRSFMGAGDDATRFWDVWHDRLVGTLSRYGGTSLPRIFYLFSKTDDWRKRRRLASAMAEMDGAASFLMARIAAEDPDARASAVELLADTDCRHGFALRGCIDVPSGLFLELSGHPEPGVREHAATGLGLLDPEVAIPVLASLLEEDPDSRVRLSAAVALDLGWGGRRFDEGDPSGALLLEAMHSALGDPSPEVRWRAAWNIGNGDRIDGPIVQTLIETLDDESPAVREMAILALGSAVGNLRASKALEECLKSQDTEIRVNAMIALAAVWREQERKPPALLALLSDPDERTRAEAARWIHFGTPPDASAVPALTRALSDPNATVRANSAESLACMGPTAQPAVPALLESLKDPSPRVRWHATVALGRVGGPTETIVPALLGMIETEPGRKGATVLPEGSPFAPGRIASERPPVRVEAIESLGWIGAASEAAVPRLLAILQDPNDKDRGPAGLALCRIGHQPEQVVPALENLIREDDGIAETRAIQGLVALALKCPEVVIPAMDRLLHQRDSSEVSDLIEALVAGDLNSPPVVRVLLQALEREKESRFLRYLIISGLRELGAEAAIPPRFLRGYEPIRVRRGTCGTERPFSRCRWKSWDWEYRDKAGI